MQTAKALLLMLIFAGLLAACGLRGPLYLPDEKSADQQLSDQPAASDENSEEEKERKKDQQQTPASGQ